MRPAKKVILASALFAFVASNVEYGYIPTGKQLKQGASAETIEVTPYREFNPIRTTAHFLTFPGRWVAYSRHGVFDEEISKLKKHLGYSSNSQR